MDLLYYQAMEITRGRVVKLDTTQSVPSAEVEVTASPPCARCAAGKGCGAGLLGQDKKNRCVHALIGTGIRVEKGDVVQISLAPENLLRASWLVYGLPLGWALVGAALAYVAGLGDLAAAGAALAGVGVGLVAARRRLRSSECLRQFTPTIVERLPAPE